MDRSARSAGSARSSRSTRRAEPTGARTPLAALTALLLLASALLVVLGAGSPARADTALDCAPDPVRCPSKPLFGAFLPAVPGASVDLAGLQRFGEAVGKQPTVALSFQTFSAETDLASLRAVRASGRLPMVTWEPWSPGHPTANPFPLRDIAAGRFDTYLRRQAQAFAAAGGPVALRLAHEMNGGWYPWGRGVNGNTDADYVAMFRHVHEVFDAAGARDVLWVWAPNVTEWHPGRDLAGVYPGDGYVDWVGLTGYFAYSWDRFDGLYRETLPHVDAVAPHKPLYVVETGVLPGEGRAAQVHDLLQGLLRTPRFIGFTWLEKDARAQGRPDWRVSADEPARAALAGELASPWWTDAAHPDARVLAPPVPQDPPGVTAASDASTMTGTPGTWRTSAEGGPVRWTAQWQRCTGAEVAGCTPVGPATTSDASVEQRYTPTAADAGRLVRLRVTVGNTYGTATAWSPAVPAAVPPPDLPVVQARDGALRVLFPPPAPGTTSWRLTVDGVAKPLVPVATAEYWLVPLANARSVTVGLAAVVQAAEQQRSSSPVTLTAVPMAAPFVPYVEVVGSCATWRLPVAPAGAQRWTLTLDGVAHDLPATTAGWTAAGLAPGRSHPWTLTAGAGTAAGRSSGAVTPAVSGAVSPLATPRAPTVAPTATGALLTFPALPAGADGWRLTVGTATYRTAAGSLALAGLRAGSTPWTLRATSAGATSDAATGTLTPAAVRVSTGAVLHRAPPSPQPPPQPSPLPSPPGRAG